jgi:hypothetical protein
MIENFTEYWENKKAIFEKIGIDRDTAKMIWNDALDCVMLKLATQ